MSGGDAASEDDESDDTGEGEPLEVLIGELWCTRNAYSGVVSGTLIFDGTSGLTPVGGGASNPGGYGGDRFGVYVSFEADSCEAFMGLMHAEVETIGCTAGPSGPGDFQDVFQFFFVCEGDRSGVIHAIGEMSRNVLAYSP